MANLIKKFITSFFFLGFAPFMPGTVGSLAGLAIYLLFKNTPSYLFSIHILIIILGFLFSGQATKLFGEKDSQKIVIDEVNGILIAFLFLPVYPHSLEKVILIAGFVIFRILDIFKIFPAGRIQRLPGSIGIMGDDIIAGIYTNLILRLVIFLL